MAETKNLCAQIPIALHERVSEERERLGQTTSEYITQLIQEYYNMMEELFQRIKRHLEREGLRTGRKLTQRDFVLGLITQALDAAEVEQDTPTGAPVGPCEEPSPEEAGTEPNEEYKAV